MNKNGSSFRTTFGLMSRVGNYSGRSRFSGALLYIPLVGLIVTLIVYAVYAGLSNISPDPFIVIFVLIVVQYLLFNLFHFDGYLDTVDAFSCFAEKEKRLTILKDVHIGTFASFFGALYIGAKLYLLTKAGVYFYILGIDSVSRWALILLFFSYPLSGRSAAALLPLISKPAKKEGLGASLKDARSWTGIIGIIIAHIPGIGLYITAYLLFSSLSLLFFLSCGGAFIAFVVTGLVYKRKAGGYTGDAFGFAIELGEILHMLIFYLLLTFGLG